MADASGRGHRRGGRAGGARRRARRRSPRAGARPSPSCSASTPPSPTPTRCSVRPPPPALTEYALRYAESGRLDSGAVPGALLPRFARPGRRGQLPDDLADAFGSVVRVNSADWDACDHAALPARSRLTRPEREAGLRVATAPMIREPDELEWKVEERAGLRFYRIHPADREPTRARVEKVIAAWDEQDVAIGIAPELCLSRALLERWQVALKRAQGAGPAGCASSWRAAATWTAPHRRRTKRCCSTRARARCSSASARSTRSTSRRRTSSCGGWPIA